MQLEQRELGRGTTGPKDVDKTVVVKMVTLRGNWILQDAMKMWMGAFVETRTAYTASWTRSMLSLVRNLSARSSEAKHAGCQPWYDSV